jgi:hypothetical protein
VTAYTNFTIKDCGGDVHEISVPRVDRGLPAMDALPSSLSRRRPTRDQEEGALPEQLDSVFAVRCVKEIADRVTDPTERKKLSEGMAQIMDGLTTEGENNGNAGEYPVREGYMPSASGRTVPGRLSRDAALAMDRKDPVLHGYLSRIRTYGY